MRDPCISVGYTGTPGDGEHIQRNGIYIFTWLSKGYGLTLEDRTVCVLFEGDIESGLRRGERHQLIEEIARTIEAYMRAHPDEKVGFLANVR